MKKEAETLVREILHAYNKRVDPNDLSACYAAAERMLSRLTAEPKVKHPQVILPPGTYRIDKAIVIPVVK